jgi:hypothetical protein
MTSGTTTTFFAQRRARLRSALQPLIEAHVLPAQVLLYINQLYERHRVFEAERIAGLALWLGKDRGTAWREICFEGFGTVLRATMTVLHGLAAIDVQRAWELQKQSREAFIMACGLSPPVYTRWCQLGHRVVSVADERLADRGRCVGQLLHELSGTASWPEYEESRLQGATSEGPSLAVIEEAATDAVRAVLTVSRCLWQVWVWRAWAPHVPSCQALLEHELGIGDALGHAFIACGQDVPVWNVQLPALARLELVATVLTKPSTVTPHRYIPTHEENHT